MWRPTASHLRILQICGALLFAGFAVATSSRAAQEAAMGGVYRADDPQGAIVATIKVSGERLTGSIDFYGKSSATLTGKLQDERTASGSITAAPSLAAFSAALRGDKLELTLTPTSGAKRARQLVLVRVAPAVEANEPVAPVNDIGDKRLVGSWRHEDEYFSEEASDTAIEFLEFEADGKYAYRKGEAATDDKRRSAGAGRKRKAQTGMWRADDGVIYVTGGGEEEWIPLGRYAMSTDNRSMRISYERGNRKLWARQ